ncbi:PAS domain-containing protein [Sphingobium baderi]|uniref:PAS domain-containing protein n=1 Tax=Sphingobium baderi TaxID=1332080 RepID=UPI002B40D83E|nr:PAS domain S-box protein [Sphingobium baderi]WRD76332.1 PAS domain S-box protein [Sphingobium baderi]
MATLRNQSVDIGRLRQIIAGLSEGVILADDGGAILWANDAALRMHGVAEVEALGDNVTGYAKRFQLRYRNNHILGKKDYPLARVIAGEEFSEVIVEVTPAADDDAGWLHQVRSLALSDEKGKPDLFVLVMQDVSLRFEAEQRFEQTFNVNPAPALICRLADHRYVKVNQGFLDMTGFTRDEVLGQSLYDIDVLQDAADLDTAKERLREGRTIPPMQADLSLPDGGRKLVIVAGQPIELDEQPCMLFSFADLEPRRQAENQLRASEERFVKTFRLAPVGMIITTQDDHCLCDVNDAFCQLTDHSADEVTGQALATIKLWEPASFLKEAGSVLAERSGFRGRDVRVAGAHDRFDGLVHGLTIWGLTSILTVYLITSAVGGIIGGAFRTVGGVASTAGQSVGAAAPVIARAASVDDIDIGNEAAAYLTSVPADPAAMSPQEAQKEVARQLPDLAAGGTKGAQAESRIVAIVAAQQRISAAEARQKVEAAKARFVAAKNDAVETAKTTVDTAAGGAAGTSFLVVLALIIGAASAGFGGIVGGRREQIVVRQ